MQAFVENMGPAVRGITRLDIDSQTVKRSSVAALATLLSLLAPMCPALKVLLVSGDVGPALLMAFGTACPSLYRLEVTSGVVASSILQELHVMMPSLTHCRIPDPPLVAMTGWRPCFPQPCVASILTSTSLTHMYLGACELEPKHWNALHVGLQALECTYKTQQSTALKPMTDLRRLALHCNTSQRHSHVRASDLVMILGAAQQLQALDLCAKIMVRAPTDWLLTYISLDFLSHSIEDLIILHNRILAGLAVTSNLGEEKETKGLNILLQEDLEEDEFHESMPSFPAFTGLSTRLVGNSVCTTLHKLTNMFPNLTSLVLGKSNDTFESNSTDLLQLAACPFLQRLNLGYTRGAKNMLATVRSHLPSLKELKLSVCTNNA